MFDTYVRAEVAPAYPQTIHEHKAPTDESVRLLREMEQAAERRILQSTRVTSCPVDCVVHKAQDQLNACTRFIAIFQLNGQKHRVDYEHENWRGDGDDFLAMADGLVNAVARKIAMEILAKPFTEAMKGPRHP